MSEMSSIISDHTEPPPPPPPNIFNYNSYNRVVLLSVEWSVTITVKYIAFNFHMTQFH